jgi:hypothetical protein
LIIKPQKVYLKVYNEGYLSIKDSILVNQDNKNNLSFNIGNYKGYIELVLNNQNAKAIPLIYNFKEKNIKIKFASKDLNNHDFDIANSPENNSFIELMHYKMEYDNALINIRERKNNLNKFDSLYLNKLLRIESETDMLFYKMNLLCDSVFNLDTSSYNYIIASFLKMPNSINNPQLSKVFDNFDALLHYHFFDYIDLSNPSIAEFKR